MLFKGETVFELWNSLVFEILNFMFVNCFDHSYLCTGIIWCLLRGVAVPALFRANKEGSSCPAGLCGSCLAHASNEEVLCVSCKKLQENVWSKCSEKCCLHYLRIEDTTQTLRFGHFCRLRMQLSWCKVCGIKVDSSIYIYTMRVHGAGAAL